MKRTRPSGPPWSSGTRLALAVATALLHAHPVAGQAPWLDVSRGWDVFLASSGSPPDSIPSDDAQGWTRVDVTDSWNRMGARGHDGVVWLRRTVDGKALRDLPAPGGYAVAIGPTRHGWYRVYADGRRVGQVGSPRNAIPFPLPHLFPLEWEATEATSGEEAPTDLVLRLEFHRVGWASDQVGDVNGPVEGGVHVGDRRALADRLELGRDRRLLGDLTPLILAVVFALAGTYHLFLFAHRRALREYLWFGMAALSFAGNTIAYTSWVTEATGWLTLPYRINEACGHLATVFLIQFLWQFLDRPIRTVLRAYQMSHVALAALLMAIPFRWVLATDAYRLPWTYPILAWAALILVRDSVHGNREARIMVGGGMVLIATVALDSLRAAWPALPADLPMLGFSATLLSMVLALSERFSRVHQEVDELRGALEEKVELRTEQLVEAMSRARFANDAKSQFVANMSHELRTPLTSVIGFSTLLLSQHRDALGEVELDYVRRIQSSGQHLLGLVNQILDISKIEVGRFSVKPAPTEVGSVVRQAVEELRVAADAKDLELTLDMDGGPGAVHTDALRLKQVLLNLIGNAIKFTDRGSVRVRVRHDRAGRLMVEVRDTGPGIPPERLGEIFQPFTQLDPSLTRRHGGTGLGLAISASICELLGLDLSVESEPGTGSTFRVRFS